MVVGSPKGTATEGDYWRMRQDNLPHDLTRLENALSSRYWKWTFEDPAVCPSTLLDCLTQNLPHIPASAWQERLDWGGVYVNGRAKIQDCLLPIPCKVEYYEPKSPLNEVKSSFPSFDQSKIVYRDPDLIIVNKPAKYPTMPAKEQRQFSLKTAIEKLTGESVHIPSRLDTSVSGLVPVSISQRMHPLIQQVYESRSVQKLYVLGTDRPPRWSSCSCIGSISRSPVHPILRHVSEQNAQSAMTTFSVVRSLQENYSPATLMWAQPITGRTHQIRVHAAFMGCPIWGDNFYGGATAEELHLACYRLKFCHPLTGTELDISIPDGSLPQWLRDAGFDSEAIIPIPQVQKLEP